MPLKPCFKCNQEVSTQAPNCPKCGTPNPADHAGHMAKNRTRDAEVARFQREGEIASKLLNSEYRCAACGNERALVRWLSKPICDSCGHPNKRACPTCGEPATDVAVVETRAVLVCNGCKRGFPKTEHAYAQRQRAFEDEQRGLRCRECGTRMFRWPWEGAPVNGVLCKSCRING